MPGPQRRIDFAHDKWQKRERRSGRLAREKNYSPQYWKFMCRNKGIFIQNK